MFDGSRRPERLSSDATGITWSLLPALQLLAAGVDHLVAEHHVVGGAVLVDEMTIRIRMAAPELTTGRRAPGDTKSERPSGSWSCRPFSGPTSDVTSTGMRRL